MELSVPKTTSDGKQFFEEYDVTRNALGVPITMEDFARLWEDEYYYRERLFSLRKHGE